MAGKDYIVKGDRVRELRVRRHMTQQRLATAAELSMGQISRIENGKHSSSHFSTLERLADALEVSVDDLIEFTSLVA